MKAFFSEQIGKRHKFLARGAYDNAPFGIDLRIVKPRRDDIFAVFIKAAGAEIVRCRRIGIIPRPAYGVYAYRAFLHNKIESIFISWTFSIPCDDKARVVRAFGEFDIGMLF